jgi:2-polyprenyl-3-methyl-5-hydroxy-6-metoxy-1,4-benzoquinol methylase
VHGRRGGHQVGLSFLDWCGECAAAAAIPPQPIVRFDQRQERPSSLGISRYHAIAYHDLDHAMSSVNEIYQHGHHTSVVSSHAKRTAETAAGFFLPYLNPGMRLLDVGCGPGSITVGLALRVEPAPTIGMDASESVIETARSLAKAKPARYPV